MTSDGANCYHYNEANQLDKVTNCTNSQTIAEYVYDYNGNRMVKKNYNNGTWNNNVTSWSDSFETKVATGGATTNTSYYFVNGQLIAKKDNSGTKTYFHNDHLGSTSVVTNQAGSLVESTTYDPWGDVKIGGTASKFLYTGQEKDSETNLNYYNARYYDSHIRRFTQPDDIIQNVYNPQGLNRYSYVWNNPLKYTDPTGHINEILAYNNALTQFNKKPSAITYNNVLNTAASIQKQSNSINPHPADVPKEAKNGGAQDFIQQSLNSNPVSKFFAGNDVNTLNSSYSTFGQKSWAFAGLASNIGTGGGGKLGIKALDITFKTMHAARHLPGELSSDIVESAIKSDIIKQGIPEIGQKTPDRIVEVLGNEITYRVHQWAKGKINVGTYFIK